MAKVFSLRSRGAALCAATAAVMGALYALTPEIAGKSQSQTLPVEPVKDGAGLFQWGRPREANALVRTASAAGLNTMKRLKTLEELEAEHPIPDPMAILDEFEGWARRARAGDTAAMLGIAHMLAYCRSFEPTTITRTDGTQESNSQRCGNVPPEERVPYQTWMRQAAAAGDLRGMIDYGLSASHLLSSDPSRADDPAEQAVRIEALGYLEQAAKLGLQDALLALHEAHRSGWYGPVDNLKAASYLLALSTVAPDAAEPHAVQKYVDGLLNPYERTLAKDQAQRIVASLPD